MGFIERHFGSTKIFVALLAVLILGSCLRFYGLSIQSLWFDELLTWSESRPSLALSGMVDLIMHRELNPPGYYFFMRLAQRLLGDGESALRFPSALCGALSIIAIFFLGKRLYTQREGLIASCLMAVLWTPIYYSQEARAYCMVLLFVIVSTIIWLAMLKDLKEDREPRFLHVILYDVCGLFLSYLHYFGLYLVLLQLAYFVILFFNDRKKILYTALIYMPIVVLYLPWLPKMGMHFDNPYNKMFFPKERFIFYYLGWLFNESWVLLTVVLGIFGLFVTNKVNEYLAESRHRASGISFYSPGVMLLLWLFVPFGIMFLKSLFSTPVLMYRNLIISLPAAYILSARAITRLPVRQLGKIALVAAITIFSLYNLVFIRDYYSKPTKEQYREAVQYVIDNDGNYRDSIIVSVVREEDALDYYFNKLGSERRVTLNIKDVEEFNRFVGLIQDERNKDLKYIWLVSITLKIPDPIENYFSKNFVLVDRIDLLSSNVRLYKLKGR